MPPQSAEMILQILQKAVRSKVSEEIFGMGGFEVGVFRVFSGRREKGWKQLGVDLELVGLEGSGVFGRFEVVEFGWEVEVLGGSDFV